MLLDRSVSCPDFLAQVAHPEGGYWSRGCRPAEPTTAQSASGILLAQLTGAQPFESFKTVIDEELAKAKKLVEGGTAKAEVYASIVAKGKVFKALDDKVNEFDMKDTPMFWP